MQQIDSRSPVPAAAELRCPQCGGEMFSEAPAATGGPDIIRCTSGPKCLWEGRRADAARCASSSDDAIPGPESQAFSDLCGRAFDVISAGCTPGVLRFLTLPGLAKPPIDSSFIWMLDIGRRSA